MFGECMASKQNLTLLCVFSLLCFNVHQIYAIGAISDQNLLQIQIMDYDSNVHGWIINLGSISSYDLIVVQTCKSVKTSRIPCDNAHAIEHKECGNLKDVLSLDWDLAGYYIKPNIELECNSIVNVFNSSTSFVQVVYPDSIHIQNNATLLKQHAFDFGNETFDMEVKITLFEKIGSTFTSKSLTYRSTLTIPGSTVNTLGVQHQCAKDGFVAPSKSIFDLVPLSNGESRCIWKCDPSYVRQPFNRPPLKESQNVTEAGYTPRCLPLPVEYVTATVELKLYINLSPGNDRNSEQIYEEINQLTESLEKRARDMGIIDAIILLKVAESRYDTFEFEELLQQHSARHGNLDSLTTYQLISNVPLRRLLQTADETKRDIEIEGLIISNENVNTEPVVFLETTLAVFDSTLQNYSWSDGLDVNGFSETQIKTYVRNTVSGTPAPLKQNVSWQRILLFSINVVCVAIVLIRCRLKCREHTKSDLEEDLLVVKIDTTKDL